MFTCVMSSIPTKDGRGIPAGLQTVAYTIPTLDALKKGVKAIADVSMPDFIYVFSFAKESDKIACSVSLQWDSEGVPQHEFFVGVTSEDGTKVTDTDQLDMLLSMSLGDIHGLAN